MESALLNNLNLKLRQEDVQQAEGITEAARGRFDTLFSAEAGRQNETFTPLITGGVEEENSTTWNVGLQKRFFPGTELDLSWENNHRDSTPSPYRLDPVYNSKLVLGIRQPLLKGFGSDVQTADIRASQKQKEANVYLVDSEAADLVADVKNAYWELVFAWQDIEVRKLSLELANKLLDDIKARIQAGKLANVEIYRPESEVARREENLITGERAIGFAEDNLKFLINSKDWQTAFSPLDLPEMKAIQPDLAVTLENALTNRPDLKAAKLLTQAAQIREQSTKNNTLPALALVGSIGAGGVDDSYGSSIDNSFHDSETLWSVGVNFSIPFNNSFAQGEYRQAKAALTKAQTSTELLRQGVRRTVRTTVRDVYLAIKAMEATQKTSLASRKGLEAEQIKFNAGRATSLDVLVAQETYSEALSQENRTKIIYAQTLAELDRIQGLVTIPDNL